MTANLDKIMKPKSIAVIGASTKDHTIGSDIMKRLEEYKFKGKIYPVNPKGGIIQGLQAYPTVLDVPGDVDLAIIVVNAKFVLNTIDQCHEKGITGLCIITAGFKETGKEGAELEKQLLDKVHEYGMRCVGPNCLGVVNTNPEVSMDGCFAESLPERGHIGFVSQSGALGGGILNILKDLNLGFAQFISIGNQADVNAETALEYWENEDDVEQILLYMESIQDPQNFRKLATRISKKKPILALKAGRSAAGASAASSHTGSLAGADKAANALLHQSGIIREYSLKNLFSTAKVFANCPIPKGDRVAVITNSGGPGIMATDAICEYGMQMAKISDATKEKLRSFLPSAASVKNPIDMIASAPIEHYKQTLETVIADDNVDMIICIYLPFLGLKDIDVAQALMEIKAEHPEKPVVGVFMTKSEFFNKLSDMKVNIPFFMYAEEAAEGLARLNQQRLWIERPEGKIPQYKVDKSKAAKIIASALKDNREQLTTRESIDVLDAYGIRVCKSGFATTEDQAVSIADSIGYPVVMKMTSKTTSHKTDVGGVRVNIQSADQLRAEYKDLISKLKEKGLLDGLEGVIIQEMVKGNREMVCGVAADPQYGHMMMFGLGGVFIEVMKDVTFRIAPLTDVDADEMIKSVKAYKLLQGARGTTPAQIDQIKETMLRLSQLVADFDFISELDINPLLISEKTGEGIAVDGRIKVKADVAKKFFEKNCADDCNCATACSCNI
ncbi:MAG TPA: GNAT family acetyltransferase [Cyanobacteria bacterium UBA11991]|nr:acetate--CoA ligase family protein [Cyanobacteriota bacterium]MDY6358879.1 acetate--CoA ligase family protein [Cyanobacteriota bacterium]MDY6363640.1 acetate--CoA ligase family protein [Cyanobacteriota bacterium]HCB11080.1 GNAT family acetyltransferase [Cyanobacteria bacterium UBA11991]